MPRPTDLPEFQNPPVTEVVLGVQFSPPDGYQQIFAGEVWDLFRANFPVVEEHLAIPPQFEMFGHPQGPQINFGIVSSAVHDRFLFMSPATHEVIQFQSDRLLHNWRKDNDRENKYPRYENMIVSFKNEIARLFSYFKKFSNSPIEINQCEISYINTIEIGRDDRAGDWLRYLHFPDAEPADYNSVFRRVISDERGSPQGRLSVEGNLAFSPEGAKAIILTLTARGRPSGTGVEDTLEFLSKSRDMIVRTFAQITTDSAHAKWERR